MSSYLISTIAAAPIVVGILMLVRGLRGRRVDDHPVCRRCGFDLSGKPEGQTVCSECGNLLAQAGAIRIGNRERLPGLIFFGGMLLLFGFGVVGLIGWSGFAGPQFDHHKPTIWLTAELSVAGPDLRSRALSQLGTRLINSRLSDAQVERIAEHALAAQADARTRWIPAWGNFVERARAMGQLSDAQWERYARQAPAGSRKLTVRPRVRRGDPFPIQIHDLPSRVGANCKLIEFARKTVTLGGVVVERDRDGGGWTMGLDDGGVEHNRVELPPDVLAQLPDGPLTLVIEYDLRICSSWETQDDPIARTTLKLEAQSELVPADTETVTLRRQPMPAQVRSGIQVTRRPDTNDGRFEIDIKVPPLSDCGVGYRVFARGRDGTEQELGLFAWQRHKMSYGTFMNAQLKPGLTPKEIVMRPDIRAALNTTDVFEIYDEELVFPDVPILDRNQHR